MLIANAEHVESTFDIGGEVKVANTFKQRGEQFVTFSHSRSKSIVVGIEVAE